jgi:hypothetical protein
MLSRCALKSALGFSCLLACTISSAAGRTFYVDTTGKDAGAGSASQPWATFAHAFTAMSGGDTLMVGDGIYREAIRDFPSGSASAYTVIKAAHDFKVTAVSNDDQVLYVNANYIRVEGMKFNGEGARNPAYVAGNHIKLMKCAFYGARSNMNTTSFSTLDGSDYILLEDCWAWGAGRYKFVAYQSDHVIFRRCVSRQDFTDDADNQSATFTNYDSKNVLYQNAIALDCGENPELYGIDYGGIWFENNEQVVNNITVQGSIFINLGTTVFSDPKIYGAHVFQNVVAWNSLGGCEFMNDYDNWQGHTSPSLTVSHATVGNIYGIRQDATPAGGIGFTGYPSLSDFPANITNSLLYQCNAYGLGTDINSDYNNFFGNKANYMPGGYGAGAHDRSVNPGIKYIVRVENNSPLKGAASDGGDIGATIVFRYGVSGALWGESGYDQLTSEPLWPYPYEAEIKSDMSSWTGPHNGKRGFCANGNGLYGGPITLTSYIWEYLGNPCPPEIYGTVSEVKNNAGQQGPDFQIYLNPLNPGTVIHYRLPVSAAVTVQIYTPEGRLAQTLERASRGAGPHEIDWNTLGHQAGLYLVRLNAGIYKAVRKIILTK